MANPLPAPRANAIVENRRIVPGPDAGMRADFDCMIEIVAEGSVKHNLYQAVADAAKGWDGRDPIRVLTL